ncbi:MAG TPA: Rieske (2Fe-2S) protein [Propionibacteriaceae bacterium]|nr:Rieske (2Fe-2S) protein [Propionibacteriaceae bacterium]
MSPDVPRRSLFAAGMGLTLAGLGLAACSSPTATAGGGAGAGTAGGGSTTAGGSGSSGGSGTSPGGASGSTVKVADVPVGGGVIMQSASFVVTQPTAGTFKAFSSVCTHEGCPVSQISGGAIICTCHNSRFSVADGSVISGPARRALRAAKVTQSGDSLVVS